MNGLFLTFTNESGSTSSAHYIGVDQNVVSADQWGFVQGTLSQDGTRINWSNGTYWARCSGAAEAEGVITRMWTARGTAAATIRNRVTYGRKNEICR
jgi:hypothetical protein